jgi:acetyl/propionyl-CoA carboxylase alpha subunit
VVEAVIERLLIANRGEIAIRIARACRELDIESVAVCSEADIDAPHTLAADRAIAVGPAPAAESYLSIPRIIDAALASGCDAIHPGYGFLSESDAFARACEHARLTFVGPPSRVIAKMGSKIEARRLMREAGVPIVPGEAPDDQSDAGILGVIERVGFPALVKPSEGGGGKGMHAVRDRGQAAEAIQASRREAIAAFGDGTLYVERLIECPRHVEVQIAADDRGGIVHLFERECSVQRRHQKIIEESPSPSISPTLREQIAAQAIRAAEAAAYRNIGTVEFLVDPSARDSRSSFYFLEMNTRLQVEHAVTEEVVGVDLVAAQLLLASGEPLPWVQSALSQRGHSIEARLYAEDPEQQFLPQAGRILLCREPRLPGVRIDAGVREGTLVPIHYDPLLAKVIATGENRNAALRRLRAALRSYPILGIKTNLEFLLRILDHPRFQQGTVDTGFLDTEHAVLTATAEQPVPAFVRAAVEAYKANSQSPSSALTGVGGVSDTPPTPHDPWQELRGWRN